MSSLFRDPARRGPTKVLLDNLIASSTICLPLLVHGLRLPAIPVAQTDERAPVVYGGGGALISHPDWGLDLMQHF